MEIVWFRYIQKIKTKLKVVNKRKSQVTIITTKTVVKIRQLTIFASKSHKKYDKIHNLNIENTVACHMK